jgi:cobyrinic acid a,c-diamide synthase
MSTSSRLALGTIQAEADSRAIIWGVLDALEQAGVRTQTFLSRCCLSPHDGPSVINGSTSRHLDSWLMTPEMCRQIFLQATATAGLAIIEGKYDAALANRAGGSLDTLCDWLDLPRLAIVDCSRLSDCQLPARPTADALLIENFSGACDVHHWQTVLESLWGIPVIGAMQQPPVLRDAVTALPAGQKPPRELCSALGQEFLRHSRLERLLRLATRRGIPGDWATPAPEDTTPALPRGKVQVAVAYDDAFHCYFPDTLDMLEMRGATVRVFSPLRDEFLPAETDIVYLGCGRPQDHAAALAENHCLMMSLKDHICAGRRVYAEGGGLAYLCQHVDLGDGTLVPMIGVLRAVAHRNPQPSAPEAVELTLAVDSWLGAAGTQVRGYRNSNWQLEPTGCLTHFTAEADGQLDLIGRHQVIGSRVHLNFAAQPALLGRFFQPCPAALAWGTKQ